METTVPFRRVEARRRIHFAWLNRLRWAAIAGQLVTVAVVQLGLGIGLPLAPLLTIVALEAALNAACIGWTRSRRDVSERGLAAVMAADVVLFTAMLYFTGGPFNPFSFLYLVYIVLAAVVLPAQWIWGLVTLSLAASAFLFVESHPLSIDAAPPVGHAGHVMVGGDGNAGQVGTHLRGMWVALGVAAGLIGYFLLRVMRALAAAEDELARAHARAGRQERLASLATLAAGAAHELATPLSTIATAAKELEHALARRADASGGLEDARLIRNQVERCRAILGQMSNDAGEAAGEAAQATTVAELVSAALEGLAARPAVRFEPAPEVAAAPLLIPPRAVGQALRGIVENAQDASRGEGEVVVSARLAGAVVELEVRDDGAGMPEEVLARVGEPFFTTKPPGRGMGLGVFLSRTVLERVGGELAIVSSPGAGTKARLSIPRRIALDDHEPRASAWEVAR